MNKQDKQFFLGVLCGIVNCSTASENLNESFLEFINWIREKIEEEKNE